MEMLEKQKMQLDYYIYTKQTSILSGATARKVIFVDADGSIIRLASYELECRTEYIDYAMLDRDALIGAIHSALAELDKKTALAEHKHIIYADMTKLKAILEY